MSYEFTSYDSLTPDELVQLLTTRFQIIREEIDAFTPNIKIRRNLAVFVLHQFLISIYREASARELTRESTQFVQDGLDHSADLFERLKADEFWFRSTKSGADAGPGQWQVFIGAQTEHLEQDIVNCTMRLVDLLERLCPDTITSADLAVGVALTQSYGIVSDVTSRLFHGVRAAEPRLDRFFGEELFKERFHVTTEPRERKFTPEMIAELTQKPVTRVDSNDGNPHGYTDHVCGLQCLRDFLWDRGGFIGFDKGATRPRKDN